MYIAIIAIALFIGAIFLAEKFLFKTEKERALSQDDLLKTIKGSKKWQLLLLIVFVMGLGVWNILRKDASGNNTFEQTISKAFKAVTAIEERNDQTIGYINAQAGDSGILVQMNLFQVVQSFNQLKLELNKQKL